MPVPPTLPPDGTCPAPMQHFISKQHTDNVEVGTCQSHAQHCSSPTCVPRVAPNSDMVPILGQPLPESVGAHALLRCINAGKEGHAKATGVRQEMRRVCHNCDTADSSAKFHL